MRHFSFVLRHDFHGHSESVAYLRAYALALAFLVANFATTCTVAQTLPLQRMATDPLNVTITVPAVQYESAFARYRELGDVRIAPWRASIDTVEQRGGWRAYASEAAAPDAASARATPSTSATVKSPSAPITTTLPSDTATPLKTATGATHVHSAH